MSSTIDEQFVEYIVKSLVGNPDDVSIERTIDEKGVLLELTVNPDDLGRVIGKRGATAQSLRTLLRALGTKNDARYNLKIVDNGDGGHHSHDESGSSHSAPQQQDDTNASNDDQVSATTTSSTDDSTASTAASSSDEDDFLQSLRDESSSDDHSDVVSKTRAELADLDDLDV